MTLLARGRWRTSNILGSLAVGIAVLSLSLVAGCGAPTEEIDQVTLMGVWTGSELEGFRSVVAGWEDDTGGRVEFEATRGLSVVLRARVNAGNPPDIAILPNPALTQDFASAGKLKRLDQVLDMSQIRKDYADTWIEQGSVEDVFYSLFVRAASKSTVWYSPAEFNNNGWEVPQTWDELQSLTDRMVTEGKTPWSIALESGAASGWPATDWIQEIFIHEHGPDLYDLWVAHKIPWTHQAVKSSFEKFGSIALNSEYVNGRITGIFRTNPAKGSHVLYEEPPKAYMYFLGSFTQGFIGDQFPELQAGLDYDFFPFPSINPKFAAAITVGGDLVVMFRDTAASRSLLQYLARGEVWEPWAMRGGYLSPNRSLSLDSYPNATAAKVARQLSTAPIIRFDADDLMPSGLQRAFWLGVLSYLQDPLTLDSVLQKIEAVAAESYR